MVFPDNYPDEKLRGKPKGMNVVGFVAIRKYYQKI